MKLQFALTFILTLQASSQLLTPPWRATPDSDYYEWDIFTEPYLEPNAPDISGGEATLIGTTPGAFITSSGNIYSFQSATSFQMNLSSDQEITNAFLQIKALGSSIDLTKVSLIGKDSGGDDVSVPPTHVMIVSEEELGGERGGIDTIYTIQWNLQSTPVTGDYFILFNATESSLSLDRVSLDTSPTYEFVPRPKPLEIQLTENEIHLSWLGSGHLQSSASLESDWTDIPESIGRNSIIVSKTESTRFFRVKQPSATE